MAKLPFTVFVSASRDVEQRGYVKVATSLVLEAGGLVLEGSNQLYNSNLRKLVTDLKSANLFVGIYGIDITDEVTNLYRLAISYNKPIVIFLDSTAQQYRNRWAHGELSDSDTIPFLDRILSTHVVQFFRNETQFTAHLIPIVIDTARGTNRSSRRRKEESGSELPSDFDQRVYAACLRAIGDMTRQEEEKVPETGSIQVKPAFPPPNDHPEFLNDVFVIMPFGDPFDGLYRNLITAVCNEQRLTVKRADRLSTNDYVMNDIWSGIYNARIIICDCTNNNPNVFYELGIAHTLGKDVILITQDISALPFDIKSRRAFPYVNTIDGSTQLKADLTEQLAIRLNTQSVPPTENSK